MTTTSETPQPERGGWARWTVWVAGFVVALGAGVATAHGLYEVAIAAGTPRALAWLYPLITDGLALVAYASTACRADRGQRYAWTVVVVAAGLSGLAQASYLAGGVASAPPALRFGIGAWPAVAAAIVAHLLFLLGGADTRPAVQQQSPSGTDSVQRQPFNGAVQTAVQHGAEHRPLASNAPPSRPVNEQPTVLQRAPVVRPPAPRGTSPARDRARSAARRHATRHGQLPTVSELMDMADVALGTAAAVLKDLREQPMPLQVVATNDEPRTHR